MVPFRQVYLGIFTASTPLEIANNNDKYIKFFDLFHLQM